MMHIRHFFFSWLPLAVAVTGLCLLVYATVQQNYRQSLNDPQIQMAEDAARSISINSDTIHAADALYVDHTYSGVPNDIQRSLLPWVAVVNPDGTVITEGNLSTGLVIATSGAFWDLEVEGGPDVHDPVIPRGVLSAATADLGKDATQPYENRVTWQPDSTTRVALVVVAIRAGKYKGDFVVAGRNMREVEERETHLSMLVGLGWLVLMIATLCAKAVAAAAA